MNSLLTFDLLVVVMVVALLIMAIGWAVFEKPSPWPWRYRLVPQYDVGTQL